MGGLVPVCVGVGVGVLSLWMCFLSLEVCCLRVCVGGGVRKGGRSVCVCVSIPMSVGIRALYKV